LFAVGLGTSGATPTPTDHWFDSTKPSIQMPAVPTSPTAQAPKSQSPDQPAAKPKSIGGRPAASPHSNGGMLDDAQGMQAIGEALAVAAILLGIVLWAVYTHQRAKRAEEQRNANKKKKVGRS
jgi:hypothetical protein